MAEPADRFSFEPEEVVEHWSRAADPRVIRRWRRRLAVKKLLWRGTFGLAELLKRLLDVAGSLFAVVAFAPVFLVAGLFVKLEDGGPILFRQHRVGRGGRIFGMWKFRSMLQDADRLKKNLLKNNEHGGDGVTFKMKHDPRVTRIGRILRKYSIDEFPQFFNVLIGEMSLVGPRPSLPDEVTRYRAWQLRRLKVKPGITCLWQIGGRSDVDFDGQVRLDLDYIASENIWADVKILLKTIPAVLSGKGAY